MHACGDIFNLEIFRFSLKDLEVEYIFSFIFRNLQYRFIETESICIGVVIRTSVCTSVQICIRFFQTKSMNSFRNKYGSKFTTRFFVVRNSMPRIGPILDWQIVAFQEARPGLLQASVHTNISQPLTLKLCIYFYLFLLLTNKEFYFLLSLDMTQYVQ